MTNARHEGKWEPLDDGTWGVSVRCGGRGKAMVGREVHAIRRDHSVTMVTLGALVRDSGDVAIYRVEIWRRIAFSLPPRTGTRGTRR